MKPWPRKPWRSESARSRTGWRSTISSPRIRRAPTPARTISSRTQWIEDGVMDLGGKAEEGRDNIAAIVRRPEHKAAIAGGICHFAGLPHLELNGDTAIVTSYLQILVPNTVGDPIAVPNHGSGKGFRPFRVGSNRWDLVRTKEGWKIKHRVSRPLDGSEPARQILRSALERKMGKAGVKSSARADHRRLGRRALRRRAAARRGLGCRRVRAQRRGSGRPRRRHRHARGTVRGDAADRHRARSVGRRRGSSRASASTGAAPSSTSASCRRSTAPGTGSIAR